MIIKEIKLENYRNYTNSVFSFSDIGAYIYGKNGVGKTNLLEAITLCGFGKSFRTTDDSNLINFDEQYFRIIADFENKDNVFKVKIGVDKKNKKVFLNDAHLTKISELYNYIKIVYFSPEDVLIINGSPGNRRKFFDQAISQIDHNYLIYLRKYFNVLKQRNALLKTEYSTSEKTGWDKQFVEISEKIINYRLEYTEKILKFTKSFFEEIAGVNETISIRYDFHTKLNSSISISENYYKFINENSSREKDYQRSLIGPHLDDYELLLKNKPAKDYASHGQKRSLIIALRMAQAAMITNASDKPILMFDDVMADLDITRTKNIFSLISDQYQVFVASPKKLNQIDINLPFIFLE